MRGRWWLALCLVGTPCVAAADDLASEADGTTGQPAAKAAGSPTISSPALDLRFDPNVAPPKRPSPPATTLINRDRRDAKRGSEEPLSVGVKVRPRGIDARRLTGEDAPSSGLTEDLERAIEETTFGVTGTYRF